MSSSNLVRVTAIEEVSYGVTPGAGNFDTVRFTSEALSGTPETVESEQIRTDRLSSGQVVTGITVGGDLSFELAKEDTIDLFIASAMYSSWGTQALVTVDLTITAATKRIDRASGTWSAALVVGDIITLSGFVNAANNVQVMIAEFIDADTIRYVGPEGMVDEAGTGTAYKRADKISIGTTKKSFSMEKAFLDLTTKAINYRGMIVSTMEISVAFGELVTGTFGFSGNGYVTADAANEFMTDGRTIDAPATTQSMNGSVDMPFIANSASGTFEDDSGFCIQSLTMNLNNNLNPQNCIGNIAPEDYTPGTAQVEISLSAYLKDETWDILENKLEQTPFAIGFQLKNSGGWYGFYMPAVQVSFDDPASAGANQDVILDMTGQAKVGSNGESSLTIYRS